MTLKKPNFDPNKLSQQGLSLLNDGNYEESKKIFEKLINFYPENIDLLNLLGFINLKLGLFNKSIFFYNKSLSKNDSQIDVLFNRAIVNSNIGKKNLSLLDYDRILELQNNHIDSYVNKIAILEDQKEYKKALSVLDKAISINPNNHNLFLIRGNIYQNIFNFSLAKKDYEHALTLSPNNPNIIQSYANNLRYIGSLDKAKNILEKSLLISKDNNLLRKNLAVLMLFMKNFRQGWEHYEHCWQSENQEKIPNWIKNINLCEKIESNKKILIWGDMGVGDQIIFSSYFNELPKKSKIKIILDDRLIPIYRRSFKFLDFIELKNISKFEQESFDYQIPTSLLVKFYRNSTNCFKNQKNGFLNVDFDKSKKYRNLLGQKNNRICGISWRSYNEKIGNLKSIQLEEMMQLLSLKNIDFYDLQYGETKKEKDKILKKNEIVIKDVSSLDKFNDLDGLLSLISACDFIVTTSNITAHLAGSIGKKTYLILPHTKGSIWYWHDDVKSLWYPSIQIYRQKDPADWKEVIYRIVKDLDN